MVKVYWIKAKEHTLSVISECAGTQIPVLLADADGEIDQDATVPVLTHEQQFWVVAEHPDYRCTGVTATGTTQPTATLQNGRYDLQVANADVVITVSWEKINRYEVHFDPAHTLVEKVEVESGTVKAGSATDLTPGETVQEQGYIRVTLTNGALNVETVGATEVSSPSPLVKIYQVTAETTITVGCTFTNRLPEKAKKYDSGTNSAGADIEDQQLLEIGEQFVLPPKDANGDLIIVAGAKSVGTDTDGNTIWEVVGKDPLTVSTKPPMVKVDYDAADASVALQDGATNSPILPDGDVQKGKVISVTPKGGKPVVVTGATPDPSLSADGSGNYRVVGDQPVTIVPGFKVSCGSGVTPTMEDGSALPSNWVLPKDAEIRIPPTDADGNPIYVEGAEETAPGSGIWVVKGTGEVVIKVGFPVDYHKSEATVTSVPSGDEVVPNTERKKKDEVIEVQPAAGHNVVVTGATRVGPPPSPDNGGGQYKITGPVKVVPGFKVDSPAGITPKLDGGADLPDCKIVPAGTVIVVDQTDGHGHRIVVDGATEQPTVPSGRWKVDGTAPVVVHVQIPVKYDEGAVVVSHEGGGVITPTTPAKEGDFVSPESRTVVAPKPGEVVYVKGADPVGTPSFDGAVRCYWRCRRCGSAWRYGFCT